MTASISDDSSPRSARRSRASAWEWAQAGLLAINLAGTTYCLGGYRAETNAVTGTLTCLLVAVHFAARAFEKTSRMSALHPAGWWLLPFLIYGAANVIWVAPLRWLGWFDWMGWMQAGAVFWVVLNGVRETRPRRLVVFSLVGAALVAVFFAGYQRFVDPTWLPLGRTQATQFHGRGSGTFGSPNSLAALLLLLIPAAGALVFQRGATATARVGWSWVLGVLVGGLILTVSRGAWLGLGIALAVWPLSRGAWAWRRRVVVTLLVAGGFALASAGVGLAVPKVRERIAALVRDTGERSRPIIWKVGWQLFLDAPAFGTGAGSYNVLFDRYRPERFSDEPQWAHNDYLNTLSDYGAVGAVLLFVAGAMITVASLRSGSSGLARRETRAGWESESVRQGLAVGLLAFALQAGVDFHFKIPALAMGFAAVAALVVSRAWPERRAPATSVAARPLAGAIAICWLLPIPWMIDAFRAEGARNIGREIINRLANEPSDISVLRAELDRACAQLELGVRLMPSNGNAWADLAYALALYSRVEPSRSVELGKQAEAAAERALAASRGHYEAWVRRGVARDLQGRWIEAGNDFAEAVKLAPRNAMAWYYQAEHLSRKPTGVALAHGSLTICLRLDPWNAPAIALRQRLAIGGKAP